MERDKSAGSLLRKYLAWPIFAAVLFAASAIAILIAEDKESVAIICAIVGMIAMLLVYLNFRNSIMRALVGFAMTIDNEQARLAQELAVPYVISDPTGGIVWANDAFAAAFSSDIKTLTEMMPEFEQNEGKKKLSFTYRERKYKVIINETTTDAEPAFAVYFFDETDLYNLSVKYENDKTLVGLIYLDNYEEAMESIEEVKRSLLIALVDRKVSKYITDLDGIVKKLEKDKYIFIIKNMYLQQLETQRFDILEEVKTVNIGNEMSITASVGVGFGSDTILGNYNSARTAIDMALARGGDQAVVKVEDSIRYFGGKSQSIEKSTRVKARVKAQAFKEIINAGDKLIIMGHRMMDIDCLGSAIGIWRVATTFGKKAHIVTGEISQSIRPMLDRFNTNDYPEDMFIDNAAAMDMATEDTVLVVVDVNKPSYTGAPELLDVIDNIVVFDHHRQGTENIESAILSYVEPYASSTCEMVAEIVQYISDKVRLRAPEADAMYAGIVIDTYNFTNQTGIRTFEAAAFLKKSGADVSRVRKLFRDNVDDYRAKADAIHHAVIYKDSFAISECKADGLESPTVTGAQAANELLDINGIKASIVLTEYNGKIYVSARSIDEVNVQVMMEKLGGGGHRSIAGAQLEGTDIRGAGAMIKNVIDEMIAKGEFE